MNYLVLSREGSQIETSAGVNKKWARAEGVLYGDGMKSVLRARANSVGGQNETETERLCLIYKCSKI